MKIGTKFVAASLGAVGMATIVALFVQRSIIREQGIDLMSKEMSAVILQAENVRDSFSNLNLKHAFDKKELVKELETKSDYRDTTLYETVPVVAAWKGLEKVAEARDYTFRVVRDNPRNPENTPSATERKILEKLNTGEQSYFKVDEDKNIMMYARPIVMTSDCLTCHGDPANSPTGDGRDVLGFKMENWREGDIRGAFILTSTLDRVDQVVASSFASTVLWLLPVVVLIILVISYIVKKAVVKPLEAAIDVIDKSSEEAQTATGEISNASNSLAQGACEQAAALEETSASLQEISTSSRNNANSANDVCNKARQAAQSAKESSTSMDDMQNAMDAISESGNKVSAIIKTIDEIAFQTNILALNAAVEAARAGEAGAGFAVVADEVRSLAARSAQAAQETADLIEDSHDKTSQGGQMCQKVKEKLSGIVAQVDQVTELIGSVANSSEEQNTGVQQVNEAVRQMDEVTQKSAASAEEVASASTEVSAQAQALRDAVSVLYQMAYGVKREQQSRQQAPKQPPTQFTNKSQQQQHEFAA